MPPLYPKMRERPEEFRINYDAPLAEGLVFAGLGGHGCVGSMVYPDSSLYGNHGRLINMDAATDWVYVPELGRWGNDFDGIDDYCTLQPSLAFDPKWAFCVSCWFRPSGTAFNDAIMVRDLGTSYKWLAYLSGDTSCKPYVYVRTASGVSSSSTPPELSLFDWHHLGYRYDAARSFARLRMWVDGKEVATANGFAEAVLVATNPTTYIGTRFQQTSGGVFGAIADLCFWVTDRPDNEISALADPSNVDLRVGGVPLILPPRRRFWPVAEAPPAVQIFSRRQFGPRIGTRQVQV